MKQLPTEIPMVSATPNDENASVDITNAMELLRTATVQVTAEDGIATLAYEVGFTVAVSLFPNPASR